MGAGRDLGLDDLRDGRSVSEASDRRLRDDLRAADAELGRRLADRSSGIGGGSTGKAGRMASATTMDPHSLHLNFLPSNSSFSLNVRLQ